jgi:sorbitol-specific phosphotransferase system component IIC
MSIVMVRPLEAPSPATVAVAVVAETPKPSFLAQVGNYVHANRGFFAAVLVTMLFVMATSAFAQTEPDTTVNTGPPPELGTWIINGLYQGMNIVWGLAGIVTILMIPAGLQFAIGLIRGIVNMFSGFKF